MAKEENDPNRDLLYIDQAAFELNRELDEFRKANSIYPRKEPDFIVFKIERVRGERTKKISIGMAGDTPID